MNSVAATTRTELFQFHTTRVIAAVFLGGVIAFLTFRASQGNHRADIFFRSHISFASTLMRKGAAPFISESW